MMSTPRRLLAALAVIAVAFGACSVGVQSPASGSPSTSGASSPAATAVGTAGWVQFTSAYYGFSASHPADWSEQPATNRYTSAPGGDANSLDTFWSTSGWPDFTGFETKLPAGMTADTFIQAFIADGVKTACLPTQDRWIPTTIDGRTASMANGGCNEHFYFSEAVAVIGNRIWIFKLDGPDRSLLLPFLTTVKINPASATD